jgi:hypothetical protein
VKFGPRLRQAFSELADAVSHSKHFDQDMRAMMQEWARGDKVTVHSFMNAFPLFSYDTMKHLRATPDKKVEEAWEEIMLGFGDENAYTITQVKRDRGSPE